MDFISNLYAYHNNNTNTNTNLLSAFDVIKLSYALKIA